MDIVAYSYVDIVHDARIRPWTFNDAVFDLVYMSHILEHIPWFETVATLKEVLRILQPGGEVEIWVPDFAKIVVAYQSHKMGDTWEKYNPMQDSMVWVNGRIFTYGPGEENWHRAVFDEDSLKGALKAAGFKHTHKLVKPRGYDHGAINLGIAGVK